MLSKQNHAYACSTSLQAVAARQPAMLQITCGSDVLLVQAADGAPAPAPAPIRISTEFQYTTFNATRRSYLQNTLVPAAVRILRKFIKVGEMTSACRYPGFSAASIAMTTCKERC